MIVHSLSQSVSHSSYYPDAYAVSVSQSQQLLSRHLFDFMLIWKGEIESGYLSTTQIKVFGTLFRKERWSSSHSAVISCSLMGSSETYFSEPVVQRCSVKNMFLKISQNSQENACARASFLIKLHVQTCNFIKKDTLVPYKCFLVNFAIFLRTPFFIEHLWWLLLLPLQWQLQTVEDTFKSTMIQIWKSMNIFVLPWKQYVEDFPLWKQPPEVFCKKRCS